MTGCAPTASASALTARCPPPRRSSSCAKCPWRVDVDPRDIPNGYCERKHAALAGTIAQPGALNLGAPLRMMACHESKPGRERPCVGWLAHQLGRGNNIPLRIAASRDPSLYDWELVGEQHETFEDTLPRGEQRRGPG